MVQALLARQGFFVIASTALTTFFHLLTKSGTSSIAFSQDLKGVHIDERSHTKFVHGAWHALKWKINIEIWRIQSIPTFTFYHRKCGAMLQYSYSTLPRSTIAIFLTLERVNDITCHYVYSITYQLCVKILSSENKGGPCWCTYEYTILFKGPMALFKKQKQFWDSKHSSRPLQKLFLTNGADTLPIRDCQADIKADLTPNRTWSNCWLQSERFAEVVQLILSLQPHSIAATVKF